jgi:7-cyano-7-deazaguanine tRNA-ribosyltransferase
MLVGRFAFLLGVSTATSAWRDVILTAVGLKRQVMRDIFELRDVDGAGRIGELDVPRAGVTVETPALLPVINPHIRTIEPSTLEADFGADILITNGYIFYTSEEYREQALDEGLHELLDFSGAIMTDSGSFQLSEYGEISVTNEEILRFQADIGSDIGTPVDIPTPPDVSREQAEDELATTKERLEAAEDVDVGDMLVNAPVQGSTYTDLRTEAAEHAYGTGLDVFPVGAVVPMMNNYRYADMVDVVLAAKRGLGADAPVHLFGAGHPMMFALAVAAGCDLFDSAAYALYARDDRYLTISGTEHLDELDYLPCSCPVCAEHTPDELRAADERQREELLARHNLHVSYQELRTVKQAIRDGELLELVERRARSHPAMADGYKALLDGADQLERHDPVSKGSFFYLSPQSARRPEVARHHDRIDRLPVEADRVLLSEGGDNRRFDETWRLQPPFGPFPSALSESYPVSAEFPDRFDLEAYEAAAEGVCRLVEANPDTEFAVAHWRWPESALDALPDGVETLELGEDSENPAEN